MSKQKDFDLFGKEINYDEEEEILETVPEDNLPILRGLSDYDLSMIPLKETNNSYALYRSSLAKASFSLSATGQKLLHYAFSVLDENKLTDVEVDDKIFGKMKYPGVRFFLSDFNKALAQEGGQQRKAAKMAVDELRTLSIKHTYSNEREVSVNMFQISDFDPKNNSIGLIFSEPARKMLTEFPNYFKLPFKDLVGLTSPYSIKLLDFISMKQFLAGQRGNNRNQYWVYITMAELRKLFGIPENKYTDVSNFKRRVVEKAINEINEKSKTIKIKEFKYEVQKRVYIAIKMYITKKEDFEFDNISAVVSILGNKISKESKKLIVQHKEQYFEILQEMNKVKHLDFKEINNDDYFMDFFELFLSAAKNLFNSINLDQKIIDYMSRTASEFLPDGSEKS